MEMLYLSFPVILRLHIFKDYNFSELDLKFCTTNLKEICMFHQIYTIIFIFKFFVCSNIANKADSD